MTYVARTHMFDRATGATKCGIDGYLMAGGWLRSDARSYRLATKDPTCLLCNGQHKPRRGNTTHNNNNPWGNRGALKGIPTGSTWVRGPKIDAEKARQLYGSLRNWHLVEKYYPPFRAHSLARAARGGDKWQKR